MVKIYNVTDKKVSTKKMTSIDNLQESGTRVPLYDRGDTKYLMFPRMTSTIQFPVSKPATIFATCLETCCTGIFIYPDPSNKSVIDKMIVTHVNSSFISDAEMPTVAKHNTKNCDPKDIKVILGTPNKYDEGMQKTVDDLIRHGIDTNNITLYLGCSSTFGIDTFGYIGEVEGSFEGHVDQTLRAIFKQIMDDAASHYINRSALAPKSMLHFLKQPVDVETKNYVESFENSLSTNWKAGVDELVQRMMNYFKKGKGGSEPYSLKAVFLQSVNESLFKPEGISLSNDEIKNFTKNLDKVEKCFKQFITSFYEKANANELDMNSINEKIQQKEPFSFQQTRMRR